MNMERKNEYNEEWTGNPFLLASWIAKAMAGELSDEEQRALDDWRETSERNRQLYDRIVDREGGNRNKNISRLLIKFPVGRDTRKN